MNNDQNLESIYKLALNRLSAPAWLTNSPAFKYKKYDVNSSESSIVAFIDEVPPQSKPYGQQLACEEESSSLNKLYE